jgi:NAD(P)-dependent dehydrogenase (short-subunit alcohol dehydrogenase family)
MHVVLWPPQHTKAAERPQEFMPVTDRTILIVGGATGIGRATAILAAEQAAKVIIADTNEPAGAELAASIGAPFFHIDVTREDDVAEMFASIARSHGKLDALIQTAGILQGAFVPIEEFEVELFRRVLDVNTVGTFLCAKHATPLLHKGDKPALILTSSPAAHNAGSSYAYGTSKGGVTALGITLAGKLASSGIRVNILYPGGIHTPLKLSVIEEDARRTGRNFESAVAASNLGDPHGVAEVLTFLASPAADYVRGSIHTR